MSVYQSIYEYFEIISLLFNMAGLTLMDDFPTRLLTEGRKGSGCSMKKQVTSQSNTGDQTSTGVSASVFIKLEGKRVQKHNPSYMLMQRYFCLCCQFK